MPENLTSGTFKIVSFLEGNPPTGVGHILPGFQYVYLNGGITTVWQLLVSIQNAKLTSSAVVGSQAIWKKQLSVQLTRVPLHWGG